MEILKTNESHKKNLITFNKLHLTESYKPDDHIIDWNASE